MNYFFRRFTPFQKNTPLLHMFLHLNKLMRRRSRYAPPLTGHATPSQRGFCFFVLEETRSEARKTRQPTGHLFFSHVFGLRKEMKAGSSEGVNTRHPMSMNPEKWRETLS